MGLEQELAQAQGTRRGRGTGTGDRVGAEMMPQNPDELPPQLPAPAPS